MKKRLGEEIIRTLGDLILFALLVGILMLCIGPPFNRLHNSLANGYSAGVTPQEIQPLGGSQNYNSWLGAYGVNMTLEIAQAINTGIPYGWLITVVYPGGPANTAGLEGGTILTQVSGTSLLIGGDIIIGINGTRITGFDDLSSYLEEDTLPGQTISVTIIRHNEVLTLPLTLRSIPVYH